MKDFTRNRPDDLPFSIGPDIYHAVPALPAEIFLDYMEKVESIPDDAPTREQFGAALGVLELALDPRSYALLSERMRNRDVQLMVELDQVNDIIEWLMGEYSNRPTKQPSGSADGQVAPESGTSSTVHTSDMELISANSALINS